MLFVGILLIVWVVILLFPTIVFSLEISFGIAGQKKEWRFPVASADRNVAVVVPAHNEGHGISATLSDILPQLRVSDRLIVVADNCDDQTANIAAVAGAEVVERSDRAKIGKAYALRHALDYLSKRPPASVIFIDADCRVSAGAIAHLAAACLALDRPIQALDRMINVGNNGHNAKLAEFAWRIRNLIRPTGLAALGLPCQLMGTGMAMPWALADTAVIANGSLAEDLTLGVELARRWKPALFLPTAEVVSTFPASEVGRTNQRNRWIAGHLQLILARLPSLLLEAVRSANKPLLALALDLMVPPLTLFMLLHILSVAVTALFIFVSAVPLALELTSFIIFIGSVIFCWRAQGRDLFGPTALLSLASYAAFRILVYFKMIRHGLPDRWERADREKE